MAIFETATLHTAFGRAVYYDLDSALRMHVHSALHALVHLGGAPARYTFADGDETVSEDARITLVDPWVAHTDRRSGGARSRVLALYVEPTMVRTRSRDIGQTGFRERSVVLDDEQRELVERVAAIALGREKADDGSEAFAVLTRSLLTRFGAFERAGSFAGTGALDRHVRRALSHLNERKGEPFDGDAFVAGNDLSRSRLFERFAQVVGMAPKAYADALRAEAAIGLLAADERAIGAIARDLGFSAPANFTRFLRDYTGLTPSEHRRRAWADGVRCVYLDEFA